MKEIQDWHGHSTFKITADAYAHLEFDLNRSSANALSVGTAFGKLAQGKSVVMEEKSDGNDGTLAGKREDLHVPDCDCGAMVTSVCAAQKEDV